MLGRARWRVVVFDEGQPRNAPAQRVGGFFSRDQTPPADLRRTGREQLSRYPSVEVCDQRVVTARRRDDLFLLETATGRKSSIEGVYVAGDATRDVLQVSVAAGEGASAAVALHAELIEERFP